jgi:translation initiation factor 2 subunit 3
VIVFTEKKPTPEANIGLVGHVDHGKTSLTQALTGKWTDTHSEELKRGITIRLGYADAIFYFCGRCKIYAPTSKCPMCFGDCVPRRAVSFVDAPGHETLMATVLSGASLMDGAILVIAANEKCPQPQTAEHLKALDIVGIKKIVIAQNKIDVVSEEQANRNHDEIKEFVKGTVAENAPIIPISAIHNANIDVLIEAIENIITTPNRDISSEPRFYIARSFDINKPGTKIGSLRGGVIGGSVTRGQFRMGDDIEIVPGVKVKEHWKPLRTKIVEIIKSGEKVEAATPGGLAALQTELDPSLTKSDGLSGHITGLVGRTPQANNELKLKVHLFDNVVGVQGTQQVRPLKKGDVLMLTVAIAKTVGVVTAISNTVNIQLKLPVAADKGDKVAISTQVSGRWHLIGWGMVQ